MSWTRREPRVARPFYSVSHLVDFFDQSYLMVGETQHDCRLDTIPVEGSELGETDVFLVFDADFGRLAELYGGAERSLDLLVVIRDSMLKRREILLKCDPISGSSDYVCIPAEKVRRFSHGRELYVTVSVVLADDQEAAAGYPRRVGEWIAKRTIRLTVPSQITNFRIHEMTPEQARSWLGFEGAMVYVEYRDGALTSTLEEGVPVAECFVAKRLLDQLKGRSSSLVNSTISSEMIYWILFDAIDEIRGLDKVEPETPLESVLKQLSEDREVDLQQLKQVLDEPKKFRALLEHRFKLIDVIAG